MAWVPEMTVVLSLSTMLPQTCFLNFQSFLDNDMFLLGILLEPIFISNPILHKFSRLHLQASGTSSRSSLDACLAPYIRGDRAVMRKRAHSKLWSDERARSVASGCDDMMARKQASEFARVGMQRWSEPWSD